MMMGNREPAASEFYEIRIKGHLDSGWSVWFDGMAVTMEENGETALAGPILDQPALYGVLAKIRDLGLPLLSVKRIEPKNP
jgi:hypothetical protein